MLERFAVVVLSAVAFASAPPLAARDKIKPPEIAEDARNPPPKEPLNAFQRFEMSKIAMGAPFDEYDANREALQNLQANLDLRANPVIAEWNAKATGDQPRTLRIAPQIVYVRFITGGKRFFGGAFAGSSQILLKVDMIDAATGAIVAEPQFYQRANAFGAAWSFGATDKHMMIRTSAMVADYLKNNYEATVGSAVMVAPGHEEDAGQ